MRNRRGNPDDICSYRAGYLPEERRAIEDRLKSGDLRCVVSTNALELGIDIGSLDAVIMAGYPGTMMATWQQAGRAGRNGTVSAAILIAGGNPLDQYFMRHPDLFFDAPHESAIIDLANPYILSGQILCAAAELPALTSRRGRARNRNAAGTRTSRVSPLTRAACTTQGRAPLHTAQNLDPSCKLPGFGVTLPHR